MIQPMMMPAIAPPDRPLAAAAPPTVPVVVITTAVGLLVMPAWDVVVCGDGVDVTAGVLVGGMLDMLVGVGGTLVGTGVGRTVAEVGTGTPLDVVTGGAALVVPTDAVASCVGLTPAEEVAGG